MAPRDDFHRFWIDFSMILEWISQVYFDRYCDEVESEFGFVLPRGRKDAKLRSSEGMKARSRAQNGIRSHVRRSCSKSLCSLTLHSVAHRSALPCSVHGYARVHIRIILNFHSRRRGTRSFVLSAAARALTTEAQIVDPVFLSFFLALWAPISPQNLDKFRKKRYQGSMSRADANGSKKLVILDCLRPRKLSPREGERTIFGFWAFAEKRLILRLFWTFILERL